MENGGWNVHALTAKSSSTRLPARASRCCYSHGGLLADENGPLLEQPALTDKYRVINYHRRGFAGSEHPDGKAKIADQVADARALLDELGVERTHVVGHSLGGVIGLQLALDHPDQVHTLALLEPALTGAIAKSQAGPRPRRSRSRISATGWPA